MNIAVIIVDIKSDIGCANQTPSSPKKLGNIIIIGIRIITCLSKLKKIDTLAFPIDCRKLVPIIGSPTIGSASAYFLRPLIVIAIKVSSLLNNPTKICGHIWINKNPAM